MQKKSYIWRYFASKYNASLGVSWIFSVMKNVCWGLKKI